MQKLWTLYKKTKKKCLTIFSCLKIFHPLRFAISYKEVIRKIFHYVCERMSMIESRIFHSISFFNKIRTLSCLYKQLFMRRKKKRQQKIISTKANVFSVSYTTKLRWFTFKTIKIGCFFGSYTPHIQHTYEYVE